jgi:colanic acid biosynthesis protein WcaH
MEFITDADYEICLRSLPLVTVDVVILDSQMEKTLLFHRNNPPAKDIFFTIGSRLRKQEGILNCAIRVLKDEVGIEVSGERLIFSGYLEESFPESIYTGVSAYNIDFYFGLIWNEVWETSLQLDSQHKNYKWFDVNDSSLHPYVVEKTRKTIGQLKTSSKIGIRN